MKKALTAAILAMLPMFVASVQAGWSSYDPDRLLTVVAPLTDVTWGNPHGTAKVTVDKVQWDVVLGPVSRMEARGVTQDMVANGQTVTLVAHPRSDGTREMRIERLTVGDRTVELR